MDNNTFKQQATKVSLVSIFGNIFLSLFKLLAGIFAHSAAMVSDAVHSASDVFSSIIVIIGVRMAAKDADDDHPYGHERLESVAAITLAIVLLVTGLFIGHTAIENLSAGDSAEHMIPGILALVAAIVSIVTKEGMYWYTRFYARKINSDALMADAWHHRSDALSSIGALVGIYGARRGLWWFDSVASLIISLFIIKAAYDIFRNAIEKLVDRACEPEFDEEIRKLVLLQDGVEKIDMLQTRVFGNRIYVDLEIAANGELKLREAHDIAQKVHDVLEEKYPRIKHIMIHVNPI